MRYATKAVQGIAASALAAGLLTLSPGNALANNHGTVSGERPSSAVTTSAADHRPTSTATEHLFDRAGKSVTVTSDIRWDTQGRDRVPKCARHGSLVTSGWTDHLKLHNKCPSSVTYHVILDHKPDKWHRVRAGKTWKTSWAYPGKLHKVGA
ncbi:hypothetical protein ABZS76_08030 [Streptomyces sp. NPDC005562]|uniref:hypothetical protein n=1 Tax=unclassified Streptomyces TaxID=2593676 RepID=UPI0033A3E5AE